MSGVLCLKWNNHTTTFIKALDSLRTRELYCDATIACHGKYFPVHRFVLTTCSEYFEEIFERTQCKHPFIIVKDVEEMQLEALLNYMYKGEVNVLQERLPGLIRAAEALKVKGLAVTEDDVEEKKPAKEKRKANSTSSPLQPKSKRKHTENPSTASAKQSHISANDDDITEIHKPSLQQPSKKIESKSSRDGSNRFENAASNISNLEQNFQNNDENYSDNAPESEIEDVKVEPSEIFESVEDEFPASANAHLSLEESKEESLFCSLLSPNNAQSVSEEEAMAGDEANSQTMPQCSSWSDELSTTSDKLQDEIVSGKTPWLGSDDPLSLDTYSSLVTNEVSTCNTNETQPSANYTEDTEISQSNTETNDTSILDNPLVAIDEELIANIKKETSQLEALESLESFADASSSAIAALAQFQLGDYIPDASHNEDALLDSDTIVSASESYVKGHTKPYHCTMCPIKCRDKAALKLHVMRKHTLERPFSCSMCIYRCTTKEMLKIHTRKHTGERPYSCPYCTVKMTVKSSLKRHILLKHIQGKRHSASKEDSLSESSNKSPTASKSNPLKSYDCPQCDYSTQMKSNLNLHIMRIHTGEKPMACVICPYRTTTKAQLQKHMRRHTGERPFECSFCSYRAAQKHCLLRHMHIHTK